MSLEDSQLWQADDIARYLQLSKGSVQSRIISKADFPKAVKLPSGGRRWVPSEVQRWALRSREQA